MYTVENESLTTIADSIRKKTKKTEKLAFPAGFVSAIDSIETGGGGGTPAEAVTEKDVNFYDYDGTLIASYTEDEAKTLTTLPTPPEHAGLVFQEWNYTLDEIIANADACDIGALYTTDDGKTRLYITVCNADRSLVYLGYRQTKSAGILIDWGDGNTERSEASTGLGVSKHSYEAAGDYVITFTVDDDCSMSLGGGGQNPLVYGDGSRLSALLRRIEIGNNVTTLYSACVRNSYWLELIAMNKNISSIEANVFSGCSMLKFLVIPSAIKTIFAYTLSNCYRLAGISIPAGITAFNSDISYAYKLRRAVLTGIEIKTLPENMFNTDYSLVTVILKHVTKLGNSAFNSCKAITRIEMPEVESIGQYSLYSSGITEFDSGDKLASIPNSMFASSVGLYRARLGKCVTAIGDRAFSSCTSLISVVCEGDITSIGNSAFDSCKYIKILDLSHCTTIPTLSSSITTYPSDFEVLVPAALAEEWKTATNWTNLASKIRGV